MVTVPHMMVRLERMLDYRGVGLERFHCIVCTHKDVQTCDCTKMVSVQLMYTYNETTFICVGMSITTIHVLLDGWTRRELKREQEPKSLKNFTKFRSKRLGKSNGL